MRKLYRLKLEARNGKILYWSGLLFLLADSEDEARSRGLHMLLANILTNSEFEKVLIAPVMFYPYTVSAILNQLEGIFVPVKDESQQKKHASASHPDDGQKCRNFPRQCKDRLKLAAGSAG